ncbi:obsolete signal transducer [Mactra antiquata]
MMDDMYSEEYLNSLGIKISFNFTEEFGPHGNHSYENKTMDAEDDTNYEKALLNYYLMGIGGTTLCAVGIVCNILSVIVLTRRVMNSSTYSYLAALAVCDTLALFLTMVMNLLSEDTTYPVKGAIDWTKPAYALLFPYLHPAAVTFQVTSIWLTLAFTVDRYIMICHPFKAERMCSTGRARKVIIGIYILGMVFNIPRFLEYKSSSIPVPSANGDVKTLLLVEYTSIGNNQLFIDIVHSYMYLTFVCVIPFLTLAILNTFLMYAVHMSKKNARLINAKEKKRNDTTVMLIGVIILFLVCQGPALISRMVYAIDIQRATASMTYHKVNEVGNFLVIVNSAINIVPYYFFGKRFRREFWRLFCKCFLSKNELKKMKRSLSFSIDNRRRVSQCSMASQYEMNGYNQSETNLKVMTQRDSGSPLLTHVHRDSIQTTCTLDCNGDRISPCSLTRTHSPSSLRVVWGMDSNKNEKCNVTLDKFDSSDMYKL